MIRTQDMRVEGTCRRCNAPKLIWQVYCGALCSTLYDSGDTDPKSADSFESQFTPNNVRQS